MDHLTALKVFRQVVELGSFAEASRQLGFSPAAISKNVSELEAHLDVRLLNRTTRRMSKTEAGEIYYRQVSRILDELKEAETSLGPMQHMPSGQLRVTAPMTLALLKLSSQLPGFLSANPKLSVDLNLESRRVNIVEEGYDLAIRASDGLVDSSLIAKKLMTMQQVVCGSPAYFKQHGVPGKPDDLINHNCIKFTLSGHVDDWDFAKGDETARVQVDGRYRVTSSLAVQDALLEDFGVSLLPRIYVEEYLEQGRLRTVLDDWKAVESSVYAVYPSRQYLAPKVRAFIDFVVEVLKDK
jgi:DNA-binding transcriptional LysR family regulator